MADRRMDYLLKNSKQKEKELKYDFMPSLLEIIERPANKSGKIIILGIFFLFIAIVLWASLAKLDMVIQTDAEIKPKGEVTTLQSYTQGIVDKVSVSDGQYVKKGDVLFSLNKNASKLDSSEIEEKKKSFQDQLGLYKIIEDGGSIEKIRLADYDELSRAYLKTIIESERAFQKTVTQLEKRKNEITAERDVIKEMIKSYKKDHKVLDEYKVQEEKYNQLSENIETVKNEIESTIQKHQSEIAQAKAETAQQIAVLEADEKRIDMNKKYLEIKAPKTGYYTALEKITPGSVVQTAQALATITPEKTPMEAEGYILNKDIASIKMGTPVEISLAAYPSNEYGTIKGKVKYISPVPVVHKKLGSVYVVKAEFKNCNKKIHISPGILGNMNINIGKRRVITYFLEPILKGLETSFKEP